METKSVYVNTRRVTVLSGANALREFERAVLPVEGEVVDVYGAGGTEDSRRQPVAETTFIHQDVAVVGHLELGVVTAAQETRHEIHLEDFNKT